MKPAGVGLLFVLHSLFAQTPNILNIGYSVPEPVRVAPGQVITLFARTQTPPATPLTASGATLPTTLGGFAVALTQTFSQDPIPVPLLAVAPAQTCSSINSQNCTTYTAITIQVPFELVPNVEGSRLPENFAQLTISDNGTAGAPTALTPVTDSIHIINSCDTALTPKSGPCNAMFLHSDGSTVTTKRPANPGETITAQAYGLGSADSKVATGAQSPSPAVGVSGVMMALRYGANLAITSPDTDGTAVSAQLVPGTVGLYQLSFQIPPLPDGAPECGAATSNFTLVIGRGVSFDGAGLCVKPPDNP